MFEITRQIGIDAGHRVTHHGSKCRNIHGHRYTIECTLTSDNLVKEGEEQGMVMDFGFLKADMMELIDAPCDHGLILWNKDPLLNQVYGLFARPHRDYSETNKAWSTEWDGGKLYLVPFVPTAENLARHWGELLQDVVIEHTKGLAFVSRLRVWETPNCFADWTPITSKGV